jgi:MFS family permease
MLRALDEGIMYYPLYALLFVDSGLSAAAISSLFAIWSLFAFALDIPSGAVADMFSRRKLLAIANVLRAAGYAAWTLWPAYWSFALGFVLWGTASAFRSGTGEALVYDALRALGASDKYLRVVGRAATVALVSMLVTTFLAGPVFALGGYGLVGALSVAACLGASAVALTLPERQHSDRERPQYLRTLRAGLREVRRNPIVGRAVVVVALIQGFGAVDEYVPLFAQSAGAATALVPVLVALTIVARATATAAAERGTGAAPVRVAGVLLVGALALGVGAGSGHVVGVLGVALFLGAWEWTLLVGQARIQESIEGTARATVLSVTGVGAEIGALAMYGLYAAGASVVPGSVVLAGLAVPLALAALLLWRWLPSPPRDGDGPGRALIG